MHQPIAAKIERHGTARPQGHGAELRPDHTLIADPIANERHIAAIRRTDRAFVHDTARTAPTEAAAAPAQARLIDIERRCNEAPDVHLCALAKNDAVRIDQVHLAVGIQVPENLAPVGA
jgi:hypothetical protein